MKEKKADDTNYTFIDKKNRKTLLKKKKKKDYEMYEKKHSTLTGTAIDSNINVQRRD